MLSVYIVYGNYVPQCLWSLLCDHGATCRGQHRTVYINVEAVLYRLLGVDRNKPGKKEQTLLDQFVSIKPVEAAAVISHHAW